MINDLQRSFFLVFFNNLFFIRKIILCNLVFLLILSSCTGIYKKPTSVDTSKIKITIINLGDLNQEQIEKINSEDGFASNKSMADFKNIISEEYRYLLGPSDKISINMDDNAEIDKTYTLDSFGKISIPFLGTIDIKDLTIRDAKIKIEAELGKAYLRPASQILVSEYNSSKVYVTGAVKKQIISKLDDFPKTVMEALIEAEFVPTGNDDLSSVSGTLRRGNIAYKFDLANVFQAGSNKRENFYLKKDDIVYVDKNPNSVYIFGEFAKPGVIFPGRDLSLTEVLSTSGLNQLTSNAASIYVIREDFNSFLKIKIYKIDVRSPTGLILGQKFTIKPKDIVYASPTALVQWNRIISLLLPQTDLFKSYSPLIQDGFDSTMYRPDPRAK
jgi:polysaccharide biosynthesis/export protein